MKYVFRMTLGLALLASASALAHGGKYGNKIDVMTQNQYLGADLTSLLATDTPFNEELIDVLQQIAANDYPARARKLAKLIAHRLPHLVGLQEMFIFECHDSVWRDEAGKGCDDPLIKNAFNDHLQRTLDELARLQRPYVDVAIVNNLDLTGVFIDGLPPGIPVWLYEDSPLDEIPDITVTVLDRDVILARDVARDDVAASVTHVLYSNVCARPSADGGPGCNYQAFASAQTPLGNIPVERGWVGVDATIGGKDYRFVNTHLSVQRPDGTDASSIIQALQADELIQMLGKTTPAGVSLILVGDINSSPEDPMIPNPTQTNPFPSPFDEGIIPPYTQLVEAGYTDAWDLRPGNQPGFTCCQLDDLSNRKSILDERIDVIFSADVPSRVRNARVLGARVWDKTWPTRPISPPVHRLWPSDHGSVAAQLRFR